MKRTFFLLLLFAIFHGISAKDPVKIGIAGLSHSHVVPLLRDRDRLDIQIVGIAESNRKLAKRYVERFNIDTNLIFNSLDEMLDATKPEGVVTFTSIYEHLEVVEKCAPRGIHVMVEKPLAVSVDHAKRMIFLSKKYETLLLTNYETSYYPSVYELSEIIQEGKLGELRKIIVYDGHKGPKEINVNEEFLDWLRDPVLNGGGAVIDFGCYGANLITWLMNGKRPGSVYASLKTYKPDVYPEVDDDATIVLSYPEMECVIHASWNWPFSRKDMHVYGTNGYFLQDDQRNIRFRFDSNEKEQQMLVPPNKAPFTNAYSFFASAIQGDILIDPADLASTETNLTVVMILEAAIESSRINAEVSLSE